jgi:flagellar hook-basal body complex protein FliE
MPGPILPISGVAPIVDSILPAVGPAGTGAFQSVFAKAIQSVDGSGNAASASVERFLSGDGEDLHTMIMATQKASLDFDLFLQARNKVIAAYTEIMHLQM